uniref:Bis(5'-nucleosyl)-tetraphosphatase [asymmetrical] n=1 Tax=Caligus rogercresseyi TaxID=217165 RepID=C1BRK8_CALRO|nr:Bis5-nucleosyl-tetraphosphatase [Caligus rogercresseyi]|eukprot:TRINITY_DN3674_c0_g1_i1.p1 TRINITY_DN3674_c0_g1~~TRINITY_DN3674_c0_g1_i1.p1  ORF type:complete len:148 (+),score=46.19 TRINITY_DN3674_c0_g1_i1:40-483(+)
MTVVRASGFIIFRRASKGLEYLLLKASYGSKHWTPPKGHVDPGESIMETAIRETREESGLQPSTDFKILQDYQKVLKYEVKSHKDGVIRSKETIYFLGEMLPEAKDVILSEEHTEFKWVSLADYAKISEFPDFLNALTEVEKFIKDQ